MGVNLCVCVSEMRAFMLWEGREKKKQEHKAQCLPISFAYFIVFIVSFLFSIYGKFVKFHNTFKMTSYNSCGGW